ncbi:hypothetical protein DAT35_47400 [Vitiosangium sp. GDMCC 1.1324]|nr:hypothetical protein DAT35_47400 [Vitiosangium sp. GDMCC 1.1324]
MVFSRESGRGPGREASRVDGGAGNCDEDPRPPAEGPHADRPVTGSSSSSCHPVDSPHERIARLAALVRLLN